MKHIFTWRHVSIVAVALVMLTAFSCKDKKPAPTNETGFEMSMTNADSTAVVQLVEQFFGYAENEGYTEAAAMLLQPTPILIRFILNQSLLTTNSLIR